MGLYHKGLQDFECGIVIKLEGSAKTVEIFYFWADADGQLQGQHQPSGVVSFPGICDFQGLQIDFNLMPQEIECPSNFKIQ